MAGVLKAYVRTTKVQIAALLYFLTAGILTQVPLFNYLGYEFSALMTIPSALISGILTLLFLDGHRTLPMTRRTWMRVIGDYAVVNLLLLMIPLTVMSLNAFVVKNCAFGKGLAYFILLPVSTSLFAISLALVIGIVFRYAKTIFVLTVVGILSHIVMITYTQPQLFAYNFILGYFPGITYDEVLSDMTSLVLYRLFTLLASLMFICLFIMLLRSHDVKERLYTNIRRFVRNVKNDIVISSSFLICFMVLLIGHVNRDMMGFEYSASDIQRSLGRRSESNNFIIYYASDDHSADHIRKLKAVAEFHYRLLSDALNTGNNKEKKIEVYLYPEGDIKQRLIGTRNTNIAKPWKREIHLTTQTFSSTFRHELVHILAAEFGYPIIRASTRMGLNEGLAVALDWEAGLFTPHQYSAALLREKALDQVEQLFTMTGFATQQSSFAYLVSGSFTRYLIERYGIERFLKVFPNGKFMSTFGESLPSLINDWKAFLRRVDAAEIPSETVRTLFLQQSIFYKVCAREVAEQNTSALEAYRSKEFLKAEKQYKASYANAPSAFALRGLFQSYLAQQRFDDVIAAYSELPQKSLLRNNPSVQIVLGDAYYLKAQTDSALEHYRQVRSMNISESMIELSALRMQFVRDQVDPIMLHALLYAGEPDSVRMTMLKADDREMNEVPSLHYFRALITPDTLTERITLMMSSVSKVSSMELKYFSLMRAGVQLFSLNRFEEAKGMYWQAKNYAPTEAKAEYLDEQIDLCDFVRMEMK